MEPLADPGLARLGRYRLLRKVGKGGMSTVYHAVQEGPHGFENEVAIKLIDPDLLQRHPAIVRSLVDEARVAARIRHPNVVRILDLVDEGSRVYMVMDFVDGVSLKNVLDMARLAHHPPPLAPLLEVLAAACDGLHAAHKLTTASGQLLRLVHRDVKPGNILVSHDGHTKMADFGIARFHDRGAESTDASQMKGTPAYMAPEQCLGSPVDHRADVFSMGLTLYTMVTTRLAFNDESPLAIALKIAKRPLTRHAEELEAVLPGMGQVFATATAKEPGERYQDARKLGQALRALHATVRAPASLSELIAFGGWRPRSQMMEEASVLLASAVGGGFDPSGLDPDYDPSGVDPDYDPEDQPTNIEAAPIDSSLAGPARLGSSQTGTPVWSGTTTPADDPEEMPTDSGLQARPELAQAQPTAPPPPHLDPEVTPPAGPPPDMPAPGPLPAGRPPGPPPPGPLGASGTLDATFEPISTTASPAGAAFVSPVGEPSNLDTERTGQHLRPERDYRGRVIRRAPVDPKSVRISRWERIGVLATFLILLTAVGAIVVAWVLNPPKPPEDPRVLVEGDGLGGALPMGAPADAPEDASADTPASSAIEVAQETTPAAADSAGGEEAAGEPTAGDAPAVLDAFAEVQPERSPAESEPAAQAATPSPTEARAGPAATAAKAGPTPEPRPKAPPPPAKEEAPTQASADEGRARKKPRAEAPAEQPAAEAPPPAGAPGSLTVSTYPYAEVWVDGKKLGRTPVKKHSLPPGSHRLKLVFPSLGDQAMEETVQVSSGEETRFVRRLKTNIEGVAPPG